MTRRVLQLSVIFLGLMFTMGASDANSRFESLGHKMMCQCGCNQVLLECNHVGCTVSEQMRAELSAAIASGADDQTILQKFVAKYGPVVLAAPTHHGFDRVAWIMPYAALFGGLLLCVLLARTWKSRMKPANASAVNGMDVAELDSYREQARQETEI
jgi:cytochrome c-type biogenesis protein CcmH